MGNTKVKKGRWEYEIESDRIIFGVNHTQSLRSELAQRLSLLLFLCSGLFNVIPNLLPSKIL
jgi:hypothetical protein